MRKAFGASRATLIVQVLTENFLYTFLGGIVGLLFSFLLVFLQKGAIQIASQFNLNDYASNIITGIILFFILGSEFFINYRIILRGGKEGAK